MRPSTPAFSLLRRRKLAAQARSSDGAWRRIWVNDNGALTLSAEEYQKAVEREPNIDGFFRRFVGSKELIDGITRYVLWIEDDEVGRAQESSLIAERLAQVRKHRLASG